ncbi:hypothetical protein D9Q98_001424 [Chlorella vulgaris]|uniref:Uncharacterized protein n=1 Tax=Chlorella vulgaris TaxID=3077 RepID=A0A9D4Z369_CHLVU|nr:hypothetical protein D9Q98_001424 [Chlorella vulgaris]
MTGSLRAPLPGFGLAARTSPGGCHMSRSLVVVPASARSLAGASAACTGSGLCAFGQSGERYVPQLSMEVLEVPTPSEISPIHAFRGPI